MFALFQPPSVAAPSLLPSRSVSLRRQLLIAVLVLGAIGPSCAAPVLPLPPPTALQEGPPGADGIVTIMGETLEPDMWVLCVNARTEGGVLVRSDPTTGAYVLRIAAQIDDRLQVMQFRDFSETGMPEFVTVRP